MQCGRQIRSAHHLPHRRHQGRHLRQVSACKLCAAGSFRLIFGAGPAPPPPEDGVVQEADDGSIYAVLAPPPNNPDNHASQILQLKDGTLLIAWFSGPGEDQSGTGIVLSRISTDGTVPKLGSKWSDAVVVSERDGYSNQNPVLYVDAGGELHLFHSTMKAGSGESNAQIVHLVADDSDGDKWGKPDVLFSQPGSMPKNKVVTSLKGGVIFPFYMEVHGDYPVVALSEDEHGTGRWEPVIFPDSEKGASCNGRVQPSTVRLEPGKPKLLTYLRDRGGKHIYASVSEDDGQTWSSCEKTGLPNNDAGIQLTVLDSGHLVLVFNPTTSANGKGRNILAIALSTDQGDSWPHQRILL